MISIWIQHLKLLSILVMKIRLATAIKRDHQPDELMQTTINQAHNGYGWMDVGNQKENPTKSSNQKRVTDTSRRTQLLILTTDNKNISKLHSKLVG